MSHAPAMLFVYGAIVVFVIYIFVLFIRSIRQTGRRP